jgi:ABC-type transport system substrate-binding protein
MMPGLDRRRWLAVTLGAAALPAGGAGPSVDATAKVLRVIFPAAETGFDPAQISDIYSRTVTPHIFEALLGYDPLAFPVKLVPLTAAALPESSADFRTWTVRVRPGIFFADDPAFKGKRRELVAADYVYSFKRVYDPATKSPVYSSLQEDSILGLEELRARALRDKRPLDYDSEVEGLRALDRYTLQFRLAAGRPRFATTLAASSVYGAVAREVVEAYGADIMAHPVGTGPYRLRQWRRSSRIVLEKNPDFREVLYSAEPAADDAEGQAWLQRFKGRRLPFNDGVEISVIEEGQPRWLTFLNGQADLVSVPIEFADFAAPAGKLAPNLARRGIRARKFVNPDYTMSWFNMEDPVVGGYTADKVALRRAMNLAYDIDAEIRIIRHGQAIRAQAPMPPGCFGYDPGFRTENSVHDPARAKALLDLYGYVDRDGDGWREQPNGAPLLLQMATQSSAIERQFDENWQKSLRAVGLRMRFNTAQWPENLRAARAGKLQMWSLGSTSSTPDAQGALEPMYGPSIGQANYAKFRLPAYDAIYKRMLDLPDGPERAALFQEASKLVVAYMPYRIHAHRIATDLTHPWITGFRRPLFRNQMWHYVEVDPQMRVRMTA